ncbi:MAG TPA: prolyl oligopeptidase family serine peptidase [Microlunatus sp.]
MPIEDHSLAFHPNLNGHLDVALTLQREIAKRTREELDRWRRRRQSIGSVEALRTEQQRIRVAVATAVGGIPELPDVVVRQGRPTTRRGPVDIQPMTIRIAAEIDIPATLYRPTGAVPDGGRGAVLIVCGHADLAKSEPEYQRLADRLARSGLVVLIFDPAGQGERYGYPSPDGPPLVRPGTTEHTHVGVQAWWHHLSLARYFIRDALAALSVLRTQPDVDPTRVGVTGNSGGGYLTCLLMAVAPDLAAAAPGTFVCGRDAYLDSGQRQDAEQILLGGTRDGVDHGDLLISMAPSPVLVLAAEYDFFPFPGTKSVVSEANALLRRCAQPPIELVTTANGHRYDDRLASAAARFFAEQLGGTPDDANPADPLPPSELRTTQSGQVLLDDPSLPTVFDELPHPTTAQSDPDTAMAWLSDAVRRPRVSVELSGRRWFDPIQIGPVLQARQGFWQTERGVVTAGVLVQSTADIPTTLRVVMDDSGIPGLTAAAAAAIVDRHCATMFLDVRGTGTVLPHDREGKDPRDIESSLYKGLCDLLWLGDSLQAGRTWDLVRTLELVTDGLLPDLTFDRFEVVASGRHGLTAITAALLDERVGRVCVDQLPDLGPLINQRVWNDGSGRWQWVLPGWPRHFDSDRVGRLLGPRLIMRT